MKYLHIISPSKRMMEAYMKSISEHFNSEQHYYYFINECPTSEKSLFEFSNVIQLEGDTKIQKARHLLKHLFAAEHIIWHGLTYSTKHMLLLYTFRSLLEKSVWIMWGIDLYNWEIDSTSLKSKIKNHINYVCREKMGTVVALLETDIPYFKKVFKKSKAKCYTIPYAISQASFDEMDRLKKWKHRKNGKVFVQVAHNAHSFNNHLEILESLNSVKNDTLEFYVPLSYGNDGTVSQKQYVQSIVDYCEEHFANQTYCLRRLMPQLEYTKFLWNMDIAIFNAKRQNALGNILKLLYMGNKVFLTSDGPLYEFFKHKGIEVYDTKLIKDMNYAEFVKMPNQAKAEAWIKEMYHPDNVWRKWANLFIDLDASTVVKEKVSDAIDDFVQDDIDKYYYKDNYLNVSRYLNFGKKKNFDDVKDVIFVGSIYDAAQEMHWLKEINKKKLSYFFEGILDDNADTTNGILGKIDVINRDEKQLFSINENKVYFCAYKYPDEKNKYVLSLKEKGIKFQTFIHPYSVVDDSAIIGEGSIIGPCSQIMHSVKIGSLVFIENAVIAHSVQIGDNCYIGAGTMIGANATIGENTIIEANTVIPANTII